MRLRRWSVPVVVALAASLLTGCSGPTTSMSTPDTPTTHLELGQPALPAPAGFEYQPDVHIVGGGHNSVISGSPDGLHWRLDPNAPGLGDVHVGDVLWATSYVAGRVMTLQRSATAVTVGLLPVPLTDLIKNGTIAVDRKLTTGDVVQAMDAVDGWTVQPDPEATGPTSSATPASYVIRPASFVTRRDGPRSQSSWLGTPGLNTGRTAGYNGYEFSWNYAPDGLNMTVAKTVGGIKLAIDMGIKWRYLGFRSSTTIAGGKVTSTRSALDGLDAATVSMLGGAASPGSSIPRFRLEIPWSGATPINEAPPMVAQLKLSFTVGATFGGANATIHADGEYEFTSTRDGKSIHLTVKKSLIDSIGGISLSPSGLVFGLSMRILIGAGVPGLAIGPYGKWSIVLGIGNGSALGAPLVRCRTATLEIVVAAGAAFDVDSALTLPFRTVGTFSSWLSRLNAATEAWAEASTTLFKRSQTVPDVPLCTG